MKNKRLFWSIVTPFIVMIAAIAFLYLLFTFEIVGYILLGLMALLMMFAIGYGIYTNW